MMNLAESKILLQTLPAGIVDALADTLKAANLLKEVALAFSEDEDVSSAVDIYTDAYQDLQDALGFSTHRSPRSAREAFSRAVHPSAQRPQAKSDRSYLRLIQGGLTTSR